MAFKMTPRTEYHPHAGEWSAIDDDTYDGAEDSAERHMIGWGKTAEEAIADLERLFQERAEYLEDKALAEAERRQSQWGDGS